MHDHYVTTAPNGLDGTTQRFKTENFRCAHTGTPLFGVQYFEVEGHFEVRRGGGLDSKVRRDIDRESGESPRCH